LFRSKVGTLAHRHERGVESRVEDGLYWRRKPTKGVYRENESLTKRVTFDLPRQIAGKSGRLLAAIAEQERLASFVRVSLAGLFRRELGDELLPHKVRKRLLPLGGKIHDLQRAAGLSASRADRARAERREVGVSVGGIGWTVAEPNAITSGM